MENGQCRATLRRRCRGENNLDKATDRLTKWERDRLKVSTARRNETKGRTSSGGEAEKTTKQKEKEKVSFVSTRHESIHSAAVHSQVRRRMSLVGLWSKRTWESWNWGGEMNVKFRIELSKRSSSSSSSSWSLRMFINMRPVFTFSFQISWNHLHAAQAETPHSCSCCPFKNGWCNVFLKEEEENTSRQLARRTTNAWIAS